MDKFKVLDMYGKGIEVAEYLVELIYKILHRLH